MMNFLVAYILPVVTALCWTTVYVLVIRRNSIEKTYGIPLVVLGVNIALEVVFSFIIRPSIMDAQAWLWISINVIWLILDAIILIQAIRYGPLENWPSKTFFYGSLTAALVFGFAGVLALTFEFQDLEGQWSSFIDNFLMSVLFIPMLYQRGIKGQSLYIALLKLVGTLAIGVGYLAADPTSPLQWYLTASILFFDTIYSVLLYRKIRAAGLNPWTRF
jgi:hypothetical protein